MFSWLESEVKTGLMGWQPAGQCGNVDVCS